jgi:hypothetical protein
MKSYTIDEFVDYCRTRGKDQFNVLNHRSCALTQFMQTKNPDITSSYLGSTPPCANGYNYREKGVELADIVGLTKAHVNALYNSYTFADVVHRFDDIKK